ncbi:MAG: hypothetical protein WA004_02470 [Saprospiraceae bacterium]
MKITLIALGIIALVAIIYFSTRKKKDESVTASVEYGPFVVKTEGRTGSSYNMNYGRVKTRSVLYSVWHEGKPVQFPGALQVNTGLPYLWKVYALEGAPSPTLVAGSQSLYLISLENGEPVVKPLYVQSSDFAKLQFLDSQDGQPGKASEVFAANDFSAVGKLDTIAGGRYLMVGEHLVLDVNTMETWLFNPSNYGIDNYSPSSYKGALSFSPDRRGIVFVGSFQHWNSNTPPAFEHALIVYDFLEDSAYTVPFDDTGTRMISIDEIDLTWFHTFFEWKNEGGRDKLHLKKLDKLPNWTGRYTKDHYYNLYPVKPEMFEVFLDFVLEQMGWTRDHIVEDKYHEYTGRQLHLSDGSIELGLGIKEDGLSFSKYLYAEDDPKITEQVSRIAKAFDAELAAGKYQEYFGRIVHE